MMMLSELEGILFFVAVVVAYFYFDSGKLYPSVDGLINFNEYLEGATFSIRTIQFSLLDLAGSILACQSYRLNMPHKKSWFESLVACTLMQFGGTTLTGLLLGQTPSWIMSHNAYPALLLAWWLTFFCPLDLYWRYINKANGPLFFISLFAAISAGHANTSWGLDKAAFNSFHVNSERISQSAITCILCGTLSACGGGLLTDWLGLLRPKQAFTATATPSMFIPGKYGSTATLNRSFLLAVLYFCLLNQHGYLPWSYQMPKELGHLVIGAIQVLHCLVSGALFPGLDVFQLISTFILQSVLMITPEVERDRHQYQCQLTARRRRAT
jgi:uncharacterized membrane protein YeiH